MIKIVNHPSLLGVDCTWNDSGKFIALGELFEQLGFTEEDSLLQNKVHLQLNLDHHLCKGKISNRHNRKVY
jgi:hypothetical protein